MYDINDNIILQGVLAACNNNCKGVDPNSIIGAGVAAVAATGIAASSLLNIAGIFTIGTLAGAGSMVLDRSGSGGCSPTQCRVRGRCVNLLIRGGRPICPGRFG